MYYVNRKIRTPGEAAQFVRICEDNFTFRLERLVRSILGDPVPELITLSGPTCAGKTTTARKLTAGITASGKNAMVLSIDDFFHERTSPKLIGSEVDFDSVKAIDLELLGQCAETMLQGKRTMLPQYDFITGKRKTSREYVSTPDDIIIFEGIQAVYPEVTALFSAYPYKSIFINVTEDISVNGIVFTKTEIRLARRIVRDYRFRSASPEFTLDIWDNVRENEDNCIFPYAENCSYQINSLQPYEVFMIGQFAVPLLEEVPETSPHYEAANALKEKFIAVSGNDIDPACLSENSLYHEFLG